MSVVHFEPNSGLYGHANWSRVRKMFNEVLPTSGRFELNFKSQGKCVIIMKRHFLAKNLMLCFVSIFQFGCDVIDKDYERNISVEYGQIIHKYYSSREINECSIEVKQIRYIENLSGTISIQYVSMHDGGVLILKRDAPHLDALPSEIPIVSSGKLAYFLRSYKNYSTKEVDDILNGIKKIYMSGWLIDGQNFCLDKNRSNNNFFLLKSISTSFQER